MTKKKTPINEAIELPKGYKPSEKEAYMNPLHLEYFRQKLLEWKSELLSESRETLDHLKEENWHEPDVKSMDYTSFRYILTNHKYQGIHYPKRTWCN